MKEVVVRIMSVHLRKVGRVALPSTDEEEEKVRGQDMSKRHM